MPQPKKDSDESTVPQPELNPLLNPLLAANMGRWAEVYFTSAPERREQAVADLLQELESNSSSPTSSAQHLPSQKNFFDEIDRIGNDHTSNNDDEGRADHAQAAALDSSPESLPVLHCSACEAVNWLGQRFCGMCGALLPVTPEVRSQEEEVLPVATTSWTEHGLSPREESVEYTREPEVSRAIDSGGDEAPEPVWYPPQDLPAFARAAEPAPSRYRAYIGVVVSIVLIALIYLAWRHGSFSSGTASSSQSAQLPTMPAEPPANPAPAEPGTNQNSTNQKATTQSAPPSPAPAPPVARSEHPEVKLPKPRATAPRTVPPPAPAPTHAAPSTAAVAQSGNAEMLVAEKFLNGSPGTSRDSKEAATWLWRAVSKKNLAAALLLSDLYVRGDGVPKSCDQARLLLDAAARKGEAAAAERLRNLQNFGCQ